MRELTGERRIETAQTPSSWTSPVDLIPAGRSGNGYRFADLVAVSNPSGWAGVIKVKTPTGATLGYILLYAQPA